MMQMVAGHGRDTQGTAMTPTPSALLCVIALLALLHSSCAVARRTFRPRSLHAYAARFQAESTGAGSPYQYDTGYFTQQRLDHFGFRTNATFTQKYLINTESWLDTSKPHPGPIFLYCGNEGPIETFANNTGFMWDIASEYGAMLVFPEHRYYGESQPFGSILDSYANSSTLQYLTSEQALADYANFIDWIRTDKTGPCSGNCSGIPVIAFGGSYGGMLAAWLRMKYPAAVQGAIAASAPIWQFTGIVPPTTYSSIVTSAFGRTVSQCPAGIQRAWAIIDYYATTVEGTSNLNRIFKPCQLLNSNWTDYNIDLLFNWLDTAYQYMAMANYPYATSFLGSLPPSPVDYACHRGFDDVDVVSANNETILTGVFRIANVFFNYTDANNCSDLNMSGPSTLGQAPGWDYQSCTEMVMPIGQYGDSNDMFFYQPWDLDADIAQCQQPQSAGGWDATPRPNHIVVEYGGIHIDAASRIVFSNGALDPWSGGGVNDSILDGAYSSSNIKGVVSFRMDKAAHHYDLRGANDADTDEVKWVRQQEKSFINAWLDGFDSPSEENASAGLDQKWIVLISVFATLLVVIIAFALFHCCQSKRAQAAAREQDHDSAYDSISGH